MNTLFWKATAERAVKTFCQSLVALIGTGAVGITHVDWTADLSIAGTAALLSVLTSLSSMAPIIPALPQPTSATPPPVPAPFEPVALAGTSEPPQAPAPNPATP